MQSNPESIIFLTPGFAEDENDTSCLPALQDFILGWKNAFPSIHYSIISFQKPFQKKEYTWNGIPVYSAGGRNRKGIDRFSTWASVFLKLVQTKNKKQTILISYFLTEATLIASVFAGIFKMKHIAIAAGQDVLKTNPFLQKINLKKCEVVVFNAKMAEALLASSGKHADHIIPMGINKDSMKNSNSAIRTIDVLVVGSLIPLKQIDQAIAVIGDVKKKFPMLHCEIIGEGPEKNFLQQLAIKTGAEKNITFTGSLTREQVFEKMEQSKILLHTSAYEGQATVITEALAAGMTVVCFDVGRIADHEKIKICQNTEEMRQFLNNY